MNLPASNSDPVTWQVTAGWEEILLGPEGLRLPEWLRDGQARVIKHGAHRTVYRVDLPDRTLYVKQYRCQRWWSALRHLLRASSSRREWRKTLELSRRRIPTTTPLAFGEQHHAGLVTDNFFITTGIPAAQSLDQYVAALHELPPPQQARIRRKILSAVARLAADTHRAGVFHNDFHTGNILIQGSPSLGYDADKTPKLYLIDLPGIRFSRPVVSGIANGTPLSWRQSRDSLVMLHSGWFGKLSRTDRLRFWRTYLEHRPDLQLPNPDAAGAEIVRSTMDFARRVLRRRDKRSLRTNRDFFQFTNRHGTGHAVASLSTPAMSDVLANPRQFLHRHRFEPVKLGHAGIVVRAELPTADSPLPIAFKRSRIKPGWKRWLSVFRPDRAWKGWYLGHALLARGIATPAPLACCLPAGWLARDAYLATEWIEGAGNLHLFAWRLAAGPAEVRDRRLRQAAESLGRLLGRMHSWLIAHRDLKGCNLIVVEREATVDAFLIDLDGVQILRRLSESTRLSNLARLATSAKAHPWVSRTTQLRFLRAYLRAAGIPSNRWKLCWKIVADGSERVVLRMQQRGEPLA